MGTPSYELRICTGALAGSVYRLRRALTLGRSTGADVPLLDGRCSRVHARVELRRGVWAVSDLGSVNGTWLGRERLEAGVPRGLRPGDRITAGGIEVEFALTPAADPGETRHEPVESPPGAILAGDLERLQLADLVQLLSLTGKTGELVIEHPRGGVLSFLRGELRDARGQRPEPAEETFFALAGLREGRFRFHEGPAPRALRIRRPTTSLLVEATRRQDEARGT